MATAGAFGAVIRLADDQAHVVPWLFGLYAASVLLSGCRLGAGTPVQAPFDTPAAPSIRYLCQMLAAVFPLFIETLLAVPIWAIMGWGTAAGALVIGAFLAVLTGLAWATRGRPSWTLACVSMAPLLAGIECIHRVAETLPIPPGLCLLYTVGLLVALLLADGMGRAGRAEGTPLPAPDVPEHASGRFLFKCARQCLTWGFRPWPRWISSGTLAESWYAIGLYVSLVLCLTFSIRMTIVSVRQHQNRTAVNYSATPVVSTDRR
jgi:hypothetical protein